MWIKIIIMGLFSFLLGTRGHAQSDAKTTTVPASFSDFLDTYTPDTCIPVQSDIVTKYEHKIPESLLNLWKTYGFGSYNNGMLTIINPEDYNEVLWTWLGKEMPNYVPIAITGFGDIFYYRKLTDIDNDICVLQTHLRDISTCTWDVNDFFNMYLCDKEIRTVLLRSELYTKAIRKHGVLGHNEIFYFAPALIAGGTETITHIQKGNAQIHLSILFQLH